ncbi:hypothetical protein GA0061078_0818 [Bifidobacterium bohemicum]|uniref:Uncharacterized protein n=1 Tax=Bifidobacterium bohemicum DSM 22767 TaxID=1437606 RepID=A0A086ZF17_9BIFI|nr:hypothetical protein [Bifidobacterium bohemicum]KFI45117.1 hypothetical protein BBOH_1379 [Bifidobacterium bohemicum DSM 22767]SCB91121.1 hypothetical protein GA0061078_0818 [Bifidobacterium bohemicum]
MREDELAKAQGNSTITAEPPYDANTLPGGGHNGKTVLPGSGGEPAQGYMGPTDSQKRRRQ